MHPYQFRKSAVGVVTLCVAAGCAPSDPASEDPMDLEPGLYAISLSGNFPALSSRKREPKKACVTARGAASFPYRLAENHLHVPSLCQKRREKRVGNAIGGEVACRADPKMATGSNRFLYRGAISSEGVKITTRMSLDAEPKPGAGGKEVSDLELKLALKALEQFRGSIRAERIGDCR